MSSDCACLLNTFSLERNQGGPPGSNSRRLNFMIKKIVVDNIVFLNLAPNVYIYYRSKSHNKPGFSYTGVCHNFYHLYWVDKKGVLRIYKPSQYLQLNYEI